MLHSSLFRLPLLTFLLASALSYTALAGAYQTSAFTNDLNDAVKAKADAIIQVLKYGRDTNILIGTGAGITALIAALVPHGQPLAFAALVIGVYNLIQGISKQRAIDKAEDIKGLVYDYIVFINGGGRR